MPVKPKTDSAGDSAKVKTDTIKAPFGRFADPVLYEIGPQYDWNREQMFATGALNLAELLDRIPQVTTFRSGWLATPHTAAFNSDFRGVRVFYDGIEIDNLDNFTGGVLDLTTVPIWTLEHVSIERSASELRIFLRTWRVNNTTPYTRADIATGNEETNLYRGFYGKRFDNGGVLQLAGQQYGVRSSRFAGSGDQLSLLARVGVAKKRWSFDGYVTRSHATRDIQRPISGSARPPVLALDATHTDAYLRLAVGAVEGGGPWAQLVAASLGFKGTTGADSRTAATAQPDTTERRRSESQFNLSTGYTKGALRFEFRDRLRMLEGSTYNGVSGRVDLVSPIGAVSGFAEHDGFRKQTIADVGLRAQPLPFFAISGSLATSRPTGGGGLAATTSARAEAAVKLLGPWVGGGFITSDKTAGLAPLAYDTLLLPTPAGRTSAIIGSIRGPLWKGIGIDGWVTRWKDAQRAYLPQFQSRAELNYANNFLGRFPRGDFEMRAAAAYEYRGHVAFPLAAGDVQAGTAKTLSGLLEIRILRAVVSYQQRNIMGYQYEIIPGYEMPRVLAIYGVRWEFWN
ncbi:MAG TPA: Plug domain-containing protein [Gemmatimonadaceae bacterium]|nr:Plug domain-containing protein [Gemmatimonadaceae bacterium]